MISYVKSSILNSIVSLSKSLLISTVNGKVKLNSSLFKDNKILSDKVYEQSIGFLRVLNGSNILDITPVHPDNYKDVINLLKYVDMNLNDVGSDALREKLKSLDISLVSKELNIDRYTLKDIIDALDKPNRDPRDILEKPLLKKDVLHLEDLKVGMKLQGTVRNVVPFGAFVDIGIKNDGLVHISRVTDKFIKHPSEVLSVGDIVDVYVCDINKEKGKVSLSILPL